MVVMKAKNKRRGRGRPKLAKQRSLSVTIRMTDEELELMDSAIKKSGGTTRGRFVRSLVLDALSN